MIKTEIEISINDEFWESVEFDIESAIESVLKTIITKLNLTEYSSIFGLSVLLTGDVEIAELNKNFLGKYKPTNVLSFPNYELKEADFEALELLESELFFGDIAFCYSVIQTEAIDAGISFYEHFMHLVAHGILHLIGYDHNLEEEAALMEGLEREILKELSIELD